MVSDFSFGLTRQPAQERYSGPYVAPDDPNRLYFTFMASEEEKERSGLYSVDLRTGEYRREKFYFENIDAAGRHIWLRSGRLLPNGTWAPWKGDEIMATTKLDAGFPDGVPPFGEKYDECGQVEILRTLPKAGRYHLAGLSPCRRYVLLDGLFDRSNTGLCESQVQVFDLEKRSLIPLTTTSFYKYGYIGHFNWIVNENMPRIDEALGGRH